MSAAMPTRALLAPIRRFCREEAGSVTTLAIGALALLLVVAGIAIDSTNVFRHRAVMQLTSDIAAHSGAVQLARGAAPKTAMAEVAAAIETNMPVAVYGRLISSKSVDIQALHYDIATNQLSPADPETHPANAIVTRLQRSSTVANTLPTLVLSLIGHDSWVLGTSAVAAVVPLQSCSNAEGLFAHGEIRLPSLTTIGAGLCLHSQTTMALPADTRFDEGARISLPDLENCDDACKTDAIDVAQVEMNVIMPKTRDYVQQMAEGFASPQIQLPQEVAFFDGKSLPDDLSALDEVGVKIDDLRLGSVVTLSATAFSQMRSYPSGLVYNVPCKGGETDLSEGFSEPASEATIVLVGIPDTIEIEDAFDVAPTPSPVEDDLAELDPPLEEDVADDGGTVTLKGLVLVTNCALEMDDYVSVAGSLLILSGPKPETALQALPGTRFGDPDRSCGAALHTTLMTTGSVRLPGTLTASNLAIVAGGDVVLEGGENGRGVHHAGTSVHAGGRISMEGSHVFASCGRETTVLLPALQVITHVMPPLKDILPGLVRDVPVKTDLPGEKVKRLPRAPKLDNVLPPVASGS